MKFLYFSVILSLASRDAARLPPGFPDHAPWGEGLPAQQVEEQERGLTGQEPVGAGNCQVQP